MLGIADVYCAKDVPMVEEMQVVADVREVNSSMVHPNQLPDDQKSPHVSEVSPEEVKKLVPEAQRAIRNGLDWLANLTMDIFMSKIGKCDPNNIT